MTYYLKARLAPTILTAIPIISNYIFVLSPYISPYLDRVIPYLSTLGDISFSTAIILLLVQVNRFLSKEFLQNRHFQGEVKMPTTDFLLYNNDEYSNDYKDKIRDKVKAYYNLTTLDVTEETVNERRARNLIREAVSQIRVTLKDNKMLTNHNIEYGMMRNFLGGCFQAVFFSLILCIKAYFFPFTKGLFIMSVSLIVLYLIPIIAGKAIITRYGNDYARILYQQFLFHEKQP